LEKWQGLDSIGNAFRIAYGMLMNVEIVGRIGIRRRKVIIDLSYKLKRPFIYESIAKNVMVLVWPNRTHFRRWPAMIVSAKIELDEYVPIFGAMGIRQHLDHFEDPIWR
jgi:hypothetical protein